MSHVRQCNRYSDYIAISTGMANCKWEREYDSYYKKEYLKLRLVPNLPGHLNQQSIEDSHRNAHSSLLPTLILTNFQNHIINRTL